MQAAQNSSTAPAPAGADTATTVHLNGQPYTIERLSSRKSSRALAIIKAITRETDKVEKAMAQFNNEYGRTHYEEYDRVQTRMLYPAKLLVDENGEPIREPAELPNGEPNPRAGEQVWAPSIVDQITDEEWEAAGGIFRDPRRPEGYEVWLHVLPIALEAAEEEVYKLLALFLMSNEEVKDAWKAGTWKEALQAKADWLLDETFGDEILELAVACSERVDDQFVRKARNLGGRLGNLGRLAGMANPLGQTTPSTTIPSDEPTPQPSPSTPNSSTPSQPPTDGDPTPLSTPPGISATNSSSASEETTSSEPPEPNSLEHKPEQEAAPA